MVNYQNAKIYRIVCNISGKQYIGSTCEPRLCMRLAKHKADYKRYLKTNKRYITSYEILKNENHYIELIESCNCKSRDELHKIEGKYIREMECVNKNIPGRTHQESNRNWYENNRVKILEQTKQYHKYNKERKSKYAQKWHEANKDEVNENNRRRKQYQRAFGGDNRSNNNLLEIDLSIFK